MALIQDFKSTDSRTIRHTSLRIKKSFSAGDDNHCYEKREKAAEAIFKIFWMLQKLKAVCLNCTRKDWTSMRKLKLS